MIQEQLNKYLWILDTITRYHSISLKELSSLWRRSRFSNGSHLPRRTFYNFRQAIEEIFDVEIKYNSSLQEYYIDECGDSPGASITNWVMNTASTNIVLSDSKEIANRIILEDVPSAREHLGTVMESIKENRELQFDYAPYNRVNVSKNVVLQPYFMNLFRQRWYVTGMSTDGKIKTYALDRMREARLLPDKYEIPENFHISEYTEHAFGVIFSQGEIHNIILRADARRAKYLRTLPLHHTQREEMMDRYSLFHYRLRITPDFISEILSMGADVTVLQPPVLRSMIKEELQKSLGQYS